MHKNFFFPSRAQFTTNYQNTSILKRTTPFWWFEDLRASQTLLRRKSGKILQKYYDFFSFEKIKGYNLKVYLIAPGYFFFEKYIQNARIERKVLLIWVLP